MKIIIHGGANQIGGNCIEVIHNNTRLIIDTGIPITNADGTPFNSDIFNKLSDKELFEQGLLPDIKGLYHRDKPEINAVLLSHYHQDHYGWIKYIHSAIPCFLGEVSYKMIEAGKIINTEWKSIIKNPFYINSWKTFSINNIINITPFLMDHSASDSYFFVIEAKDKRIVYTGDFRSHGRKGKLFKSFLDQCPLPVDLLLVEGTTLGDVNRDFITETEIEKKILEICRNTEGFVLGLTSSQNIDRIVSFYKAALKSGRTLVIDPYQAYILDQVGWNVPRADGNYKIKVLYSYFISKKIAETGNTEILYKYKRSKITKEKLREEPGQFLLLIRNSTLKDLQIIGNMNYAKLIYSLWSGYKQEKRTQDFLNKLKKLGIIIEDVHTSGHTDLKSIKKLIDKLKPQKIIPIHTEHWKTFETLSNKVVEPRRGMILEI